MSITAFWQSVHGRWRDLAQQIWPDNLEVRARVEADRLAADLAARCRRLMQLRQQIERVQAGLEGQQRELNGLAVLTSANDLQAAVERLQTSIQRLRVRLNRLEEIYQKQRQRLERKKPLLQALRSGRVRVVG